ncbi:MAG: methanogenesis marker 3 protein [Methanothrix sp.]|nr:methanogenesis marker 3 protein [Methanothrix sp.]HNR58152.1 methanogenesis marker 3 protein [Methanothrix sp.]HNT71879.1 methanogenesis marker 3 protein [Methanothrix sp.]HPY72320.1 methanogenesis marker 3 protein [Methanothrix sp.]
MKVFVDGAEITLQDGSTLKNALDAAGVSPQNEAIIGIVKGREEEARETNSYWLNTTKGKLRIELLDTGLQDVWHQAVGQISGLRARWSDGAAVAFGPVRTEMAPTRGENEYDRWEVVFGASGFESDKAQIVFARKRHSAAYGAPAENRGVFATVVGGKELLARLDMGDAILDAEPIVEWAALTDKMATQDLSLPLSEGMEVYSRIEVELMEEAPQGAEFFLAATRDGVFVIDATSSSYASSDVLLGERIEFENREPRSEGAVTIRTTGRGLGRTFIYKADRTSTPSQSVVGTVTSGMDLVKLAEPGMRLLAKVKPERIMLMGLSLKEAERTATDRGLAFEVRGYTGDDAVVVEQSPVTTMQILKEGRVSVTSIPADRMVSIELYDDLAPKTLDYFRHVVGLKEKPVGPLPVYFVYENTVLFKPVISATSYKEILPENKPVDVVRAGEIGVTNQAAKNAGLVGVKLEDDPRYGPSGEKFLATNIVGRILDLEKLRDVKEEETVYVLEVR